MTINISSSKVNENIAKEKEWAKTPHGKEYIDEAGEALKQWDYNEDGHTSALEMYNNSSSIYKSVFAGNETFSKRAEDIAQKQYELYDKYAGEDGVLDAFEYSAALNSDENNELLNEYWEMCDVIEAQEGKNVDVLKYDRDNDGQTNIVEFIQEKLDNFKEIFKSGNSDLKNKALDVVFNQAEIMSKYAGSDGILSAEEYQKALNNESFGASMEEYVKIKQQLESYME